MSYQIINGKIYNPNACEVNLVYHCNLSCRGCSHLSPIFTNYFVEPLQVFKDFSTLGKYYRSKYIKIIGGEPLLHPNLIEIIDAVRSSGVSEHIQVVTNGHLLAKIIDSFWQKVDEVCISVYPEKEVNLEHLEEIEYKARLHNVVLEYYYFDNFRESYSEVGTKDTELVQRIYTTCKIAHTWHSHTIAEGYFYKCPQSLFLPKVINKNILKDAQDGIKISNSSEFGEELLAYLNATEPLKSCYHCLGSVGKLFPHEQIARSQWRSQQQYSTEELIDREYLAISESNPKANNSSVRYRSSINRIIARTQRVQRTFARRLTRRI